VHEARNIAERCPKKHVASIRATLRKAWEMDDASAAERLIKDLAKRMAREARRSLACTNAIENMQGTIRRVTRNVKRWRDASMALRWAAAGMMEAKAGFRRLKAYRHLPALRLDHQSRRLETPG
jgi:hypothetical protein